MKVFFASFTDPEIEVDAHVANDAQGILILQALRYRYIGHSVVMRARVKRGSNAEERYIGLSQHADAGAFIKRVERMVEGE